MKHGLGHSDFDDEQPPSEHNIAAQAIHAAGLDSDDDDGNNGSLGQHGPDTEQPEAPGDGDNDFKALGLEGTDDEFNDQHGLEDEEDKQPSPVPKPFKPDRMYGPPEVPFFLASIRQQMLIFTPDPTTDFRNAGVEVATS